MASSEIQSLNDPIIDQWIATLRTSESGAQKHSDAFLRKQMSAFLRGLSVPTHQSEERLQSVFSHAAVGFSLSTLEGRILEANPRFSEMSGYSESELKDLTIDQLIHPDDWERDKAALSLLTSGAQNHHVIEKRFIKKNGDVVWVRNSVSLDSSSDGERLLIRVAEDVTEAREAELKRRESEERFGVLADSMPQIVWTASATGELDYFNQVWFDYSGTTYEDNVGNGWAQAVHPDDVGPTIERWTKALETGCIYENEFRLRSHTGEYRWHVTRALPQRDAKGKIKKWYGTNTDIHNSKTISEKLAQTTSELESEQQKFRTIIADSSTSMAVLKGDDFVYEIANKSYLDLFNNRQIIGKPFIEALPELIGQEFPRRARTVYETGIPYVDREAKAFLKRTDDGELEIRYFDQTYSRMNDSEGKPYGVFIHAQEVTEGVKARIQLEETSERYRLAIEAANMGTWELDPSSTEINWSKRTSELFGLNYHGLIKLEDAVNRIHVDDQDFVSKAIDAALDPKGNGHYNVRYRIVHNSGDTRWVSLLGKTFFADTNEGRIAKRFAGTVLDVTDLMLAEAALRDAKERAEMANDAKSAFLANMSHEIRTPLGAIMGFVNLLKDDSLNRSEAHDYLGVIERNSTQLLRIIDDILDLSKVEAGKMLIEHIDFSLLEVLADFSSLMGFRARENGIDFRVTAETGVPDPVNSDPTRIRQVLNNIVGNAIKFTQKGKVELFVRYDDDYLTFKIKDTGRGISPEQAKELFQPFTQADASTTRKFGGTGLGLILTKKLCEAMGGDFWLEESELNRGSTFVARIKVNVPSDSKVIGSSEFLFTTEPVRRAEKHPPLLNGAKVLVVEDSPDNRLLIRVLLTRYGAKVTLASDGVEGVEMALASQYDLLIMDVQMPRMDGYQAVQELRSRGYTKPIVALTAHAMKEEREKCLAAGYSEFLSKPINQEALVSTVKSFLNI